MKRIHWLECDLRTRWLSCDDDVAFKVLSALKADELTKTFILGLLTCGVELLSPSSGKESNYTNAVCFRRRINLRWWPMGRRLVNGRILWPEICCTYISEIEPWSWPPHRLTSTSLMTSCLRSAPPIVRWNHIMLNVADDDLAALDCAVRLACFLSAVVPHVCAEGRLTWSSVFRPGAEPDFIQPFPGQQARLRPRRASSSAERSRSLKSYCC